MTERGAGRGARILDGVALGRQILAESATELAAIRDRSGSLPGLRVVMVGSDAGSAIYARRILRASQEVGLQGGLVELPPDRQAIRSTLQRLSEDRDVAGVIIQLPLPLNVDIRDVIEDLDPVKDLDGIHPVNAGLVSRGEGGYAPSCAEAAVQILRRSGIPIAGRPAVVIGRSNVVGKPAQLLLLQEHATVTVCHRQTRDLASHVRKADIVVIAAGSPGLIRGGMLRPGAVVVDCGINVLADGSVTGDAHLDSVLPVASAVTPVPGGVGPVTNAVLIQHLVRAARAQVPVPVTSPPT